MVRNSLLTRSSLLARALFSNPSTAINLSQLSNPRFSIKTLTTPSLSAPSFPSQSKPLFFFFSPQRTFSSSSAANIVPISTQQDFTASLKKAQDDGSPSIFYFTATWCGPCRMLAPVIEELSKKYSHVTTYKIDIDQEGLQDALTGLKIFSVPTLHFFQNGKKAAEVIGADTARLKQTMESLYRQA